jgi:hypothetical protein
VKLVGESGGFFVGQVKVHDPNMGSPLTVAKAESRLPVIGSAVEVIAPAIVT